MHDSSAVRPVDVHHADILISFLVYLARSYVSYMSHGQPWYVTGPKVFTL